MKKNLKLVTHNGECHCDDVLSTIVLCDVFNLHIQDTIRTRDKRVLEEVQGENNVIVYDVFQGRLDHHYIDGECDIVAPDRKLASIGKIWREYKELIKSEYGIDEIAWKTIDESIISPIDVSDNGGKLCSTAITVNSLKHRFSKELAHPLDADDYNNIFTKVCNRIKRIWEDIIEMYTDESADRAAYLNAAEPVVINDKLFGYTEEKWFIGRTNEHFDGMITPIKNGVSFYLFNNLSCAKPGLNRDDIPGVYFTHPNGFCGSADSIETLKKII